MTAVSIQTFSEPAVAPPDLLVRLRAETGAAHAALEQALDLLRPPLEQAWFRTVLQRFHGFHAGWEPAVTAGIFATRSRLPHLRHDLRALGLDDAAIDALPVCPGAAALTATEAGTIGSLYVLEGSTLGGQVISRALAGADWLPPGGLRYFDPYGARTGAMWRSFRVWCNQEAAHLPPDQVVAGARATFAMLQAWLTR